MAPEKQNLDICIIVPFLNEAENIDHLSNSLCDFFKANNQLNLQLILVDDGSTDDSLDKIAQSTFPERTTVISLSRNFGSHAALRAGLTHAQAKFVTFIYADLQDPLENILKMYEKALNGNDIVWAFRQKTNNEKFESFFSILYARLMRRFVNPKFPLQGFDVVMFSSKVTKVLNENIETNSSLFLQILQFGFKSDKIFYEKKARTVGQSKWTISKKVKLLLDSFVAFSNFPLRLVTVVGILFFLVGLVISSYLIFRRIVWNDLKSGWPALASILLIGFGITNISLGVIAEYLWRSFDATRKRPVFIIDKIITKNKETN